MALIVLVVAAGAEYLLVSRGGVCQRSVREALRDELRTSR
jgi:hypothetical protein